jgi:hypothetical protein
MTNTSVARAALGFCLLLLAALATVVTQTQSQWFQDTSDRNNRKPLFEAYVQCSLASIWLLLQTLRAPYRRLCWRLLCGGWNTCPPQGYSPLNQFDGKSTHDLPTSSAPHQDDANLSTKSSDLPSERTLKPALKVGLGVRPTIDHPVQQSQSIDPTVKKDKMADDESCYDSESNEIDRCKSNSPEASPFLTDSIWIPLNACAVANDNVLCADDYDESSGKRDDCQRRVRFSKLTEVRFLTGEKSKSGPFFLFASSSWTLSSAALTSADRPEVAPEFEVGGLAPVSQASVRFVNAIRKAINCCLLWFLFCYCVLLLRPEHQNLFTLYAFLAYLLLFTLFFQMIIFDGSPPIERVTLCKVALFALAMLSVHFLLTSIDSNRPVSSDIHDESTIGTTIEAIKSIEPLPIPEAMSPSDDVTRTQTDDSMTSDSESSKSDFMSVQPLSVSQFDYKHMLLIILTAFCGSFYLCNLRRSNETNNCFCVFTFVGKGPFQLIRPLNLLSTLSKSIF